MRTRTSNFRSRSAASRNRTKYTYDAAGNQTSVINPLTQITTTNYDKLHRTVSVVDPLNHATTSIYDAANRRIATVNAEIETTTYDFDRASRLIRTTDPLNHSTTFTYDAAGRRIAVTDALRHVTTSVYDPGNLLSNTIDALNQVTTIQYDAANQQTAVINPMGEVSQTTYDDAGRKKTSVDPLLHTTSFNYDPDGNVVQSIDPLLHVVTTVYDTAGRATQSINPLGFTTTTGYDRANRVVSVTNPENETTTTVYDVAGRVVNTINPLLFVTTTTYDAANRATGVTNAEGETSQTVYDDAGRVWATVNPLLFRTTTTYDKANRPISVKDANNGISQTIYDKAGRATVRIDPMTFRTTTTYDDVNQPTVVKNANNQVTTTVYDVLNRVSATVDALGKRTTTTYDPASRPIARIDPLLHITTTVYDAAGRTIAVADPLNHRTTTTYDDANRPIAVMNSMREIVTTVYDNAGRATVSINPLTYRTTTTYDHANRPTEVLDAELKQTVTYYDAAGRVTSVQDARGGYVVTEYDKANRRTVLIDPNTHRTTWVYDAAGQVLNEIDPDGGRSTMTYDPVGNLKVKLDPRNQGITNHQYDANNRLMNRAYTDSERHTFTYDKLGNRLTIQDQTGQTTSAFTARNQLQNWFVGSLSTTKSQYGYDDAGRRTSMSPYERKAESNFVYQWDNSGRQTKVTNPKGLPATLVYDDAGRVIKRLYANGALTSITYDAAGNEKVILNLTAGGALVSCLTYTYDKTNHRLNQYESDGTVTTWTYDDNYQLTHEHRAGGPTGTSFNITHTYDPAGNQLVEAKNSVVTTFTYSDANRLKLAVEMGAVTTYLFDAAGNRTQMDQPSGSSIDRSYYDFNAAGNMKQAIVPAGTASFLYNADAQRRSKTSQDGSVTGFYYDHANLLHETNGLNGAISSTYTTSIDDTYGDVMSEDEGNELYHQFDAQGNTNAITDADGNVVARYKFNAFGNAASAGALADDGWSTLSVEDWSLLSVDDWAALPVIPGGGRAGFAWSGQKQYYFDQETELYLLGGGSGGRYYDSKTAKFISDDSIRQASGDYNLQRYVHNDPVNQVDPSGKADQAAMALTPRQQTNQLLSAEWSRLQSMLDDLEQRKNYATSAGGSDQEWLWQKVLETKKQISAVSVAMSHSLYELASGPIRKSTHFGMMGDSYDSVRDRQVLSPSSEESEVWSQAYALRYKLSSNEEKIESDNQNANAALERAAEVPNEPGPGLAVGAAMAMRGAARGGGFAVPSLVEPEQVRSQRNDSAVAEDAPSNHTLPKSSTPTQKIAPLANVLEGHASRQGFTGVYDASTGKVLIKPSTAERVIPNGWVARAGGHADVSAALGGDVAKHSGFAVILQDNGTLNITWRSGTLNPPPDYVVPPAARPTIIDAVQKATGRTVNP